VLAGPDTAVSLAGLGVGVGSAIDLTLDRLTLPVVGSGGIRRLRVLILVCMLVLITGLVLENQEVYWFGLGWLVAANADFVLDDRFGRKAGSTREG
jgi:hypothetical protein